MRNLLSQLLAVGPELAAFILTAPLLGSRGAYAIEPTEAPSPNLDLSKLGSVAVAGDFDGISLYQYEGQSENVLNTNGSQSLLTQYGDGLWGSLGLSDAYVEAMCSFKRNGDLKGVVLGGNFTSVEGVQAQSVAIWDPDTGDITPIPGINGGVSALYCDDDSGTVYVGGMFTASKSTNAMSYSTQWVDLPFAGFNGEVHSITKNEKGNIVFGGSFTGLGKVTNTSTPVKDNGQVINLDGGDIGATGTTDTEGFDDPKNIICKTGQDGPGDTWLLADHTGGWWQGLFDFGFNPTMIRLYNTKHQGRGTKSFYFENLNNGGVLNLNYIDEEGKNQSCSNPCPLPQGNTSAQDFYMVPVVGMSQFRIFITDWYGDGGGLAGIEMFTDDIYSFAVNEFNQPKCDDVSKKSSSTVIPPNGLWERMSTNSTSSAYLSANLQNQSQLDQNPSVVFTPNIEQSGNYSILVYTPGCKSDNSCDFRGTVNLTGTMTSSSAPVTTTISQTNYFDKFDQIYYGYVDIDSGSFQPSVTLSPMVGEPLPQTIVAQRVRFDLVQSTGGLNGLYEYNPNKASVDKDFSSSDINTAGTDLDSGAVVNRVVAYEDSIYVAGKFSGDGIENCMRIGKKALPLPGGGLNADVQDMVLQDSILYMGGNFTNTVDDSEKGLNNVAAFDMDNDKWITLGAGVDGAVWWVVPVTINVTVTNEEECITVNGDFTTVNAYGNNKAFEANGFAIWVPSKKDWLNNVFNANLGITGKLLTETSVPGMEYPLYAGQITSQAFDISGVAQIDDSGTFLSALAVDIQSSSESSSSISKRAIYSSQNFSGVYTGHYWEDEKNPQTHITILGGHFSAPNKYGTTVRNLVFISEWDDTGVTGISELDSDSIVTALETYDNLLFAGGSVTGNIDGDDLNGLVVYDLKKHQVASPQPPALGGDDVVVNAIAAQPDSSSVYVGGSFDDAGSLPCATLCYYDASTQQWNTPGLGLSGTIASMFWSTNTELIVAGDLTLHGKKTTMATYDAKKQVFAAFTGGADPPGGISALTPATGNYKEFWATGIADNNNSAYLSKYSGDSWTTVGGLGPSTTIRGLQLLPLTKDHDSSDLVSSSEVLMIVGNINIPSFGNASAALFDGKDFTPFLLTSKDDGSQGTLASIFVSNTQALMKMGGGNLAIGFIVLIALAVALGLIFLIVVAGILIERARRRREGYVPMHSDKNGNLSRIPPETLLQGINGEKASPPKL